MTATKNQAANEITSTNKSIAIKLYVRNIMLKAGIIIIPNIPVRNIPIPYPRNVMPFLVDTGSECSVISAFHLENNFDCSTLQRGVDSMGVGGVERTYLLNNVHLFFYTMDQEWHYIHKFKKMQVIPRKYDEETKKVIPIPCLLGTDLIGKKYKLIYGKKEIFLQG